jgi:putative sigma-54 modulation protein
VDDEVRSRAGKRFDKIAKQVAASAPLELELTEERNPSIHDSCVAEATLHLKGVTLRAREASDNMAHAIHLGADDLGRQVKRHRDKRRGRRAVPKIDPAAIDPQPVILDPQAAMPAQAAGDPGAAASP